MKENKKRFPIGWKMIIIFGVLIVVSLTLLCFIAIRQARNVVLKEIGLHLTSMAKDTSTILDERINVFFTSMEGLTNIPQIQDSSIPYVEKIEVLAKKLKSDVVFKAFCLCDKYGNAYLSDNRTIDVSDREWYKMANQGKKAVYPPHRSRGTTVLMVTFAIPLYDSTGVVTGVLAADLDGFWLTDQIDDIVVGKTGNVYIVDANSTVVAHIDKEMVQNQYNYLRDKYSIDGFEAGSYVENVLKTDSTTTGYYNFQEVDWIATSCRMDTTGWYTIIRAPVHEFFDDIDKLRTSMIIFCLIILFATIVVVYLVTRQIIKPIKNTVGILENISEGDGDLTVRLPVKGNDELTDLSTYFNKTVEKIRISIKKVGGNTVSMQELGGNLSSNMTETASAIKQISSNIGSVK